MLVFLKKKQVNTQTKYIYYKNIQKKINILKLCSNKEKGKFTYLRWRINP
jgi:hypothetical protein